MKFALPCSKDDYQYGVNLSKLDLNLILLENSKAQSSDLFSSPSILTPLMISFIPTALNILTYAENSQIYTPNLDFSQIQSHVYNFQLNSPHLCLTEFSHITFYHPILPHLHNHYFKWNSIFPVNQANCLILPQKLPFLYTLHPICQKIRLALPSKEMYNLTTSPNFHY